MNGKSSLAEYLKTLDSAFGVTGDETEVAEVLKTLMNGLCDDHMEDPLGNQFFIKYGRNRDKKIILAAHMDEIGFIINYIEDNGFGRIMPVGYHDDRMAVNQDLVVTTSDGKHVNGVTGSKPFHILTEEEQSKVIKIEDLFLDFGTESRAETESLGVRPGDYAAFNRQGYFLNEGKYYSGKSVDNRAGCAVLVETMKRLKKMDIEPTVYAVGTVQEEVGMRAGGPITNRIQPELVLAIDGTLTGGTPGIEWNQCSEKMGGGPGIKYFDWDPILGMTGNNVPRKLTKRIIEIAEKYNIPYQREIIMGGGTDAWSASTAWNGVLAGGICIPERYIHTAVGTVNMDDLENTVDLLVKFLQDYITI